MKKRKITPVLCAAAVAAGLAGCSGSSGSAVEKGADTQTPKTETGVEAGKDEAAGVEKDEGGSGSTNEKLIIYNPLTESMIDSILAMFEGDTGTDTEYLAMGIEDALERIQTEADSPQADILWSGTIGTIENKSGYFTDYVISNEDAFYDEYKSAERNPTRFDTIPSVIMMNTDLVDGIRIRGYEGLLNPELRGKTTFVNPATPSSSFEHLVNMLYAMSGGTPDNGWDYVKQFCAQLDSKLSGSSSAVYRGVTDGEYTVGFTFERGSAQYVGAGALIKTVYMGEGVIFHGDEVYIIKNCPNEPNTQKFVDWLTSKDVQEFMNNTQYRRAIRRDMEAGDTMVPTDRIKVIQDDETNTAAHKSEWLDEFKELSIE